MASLDMWQSFRELEMTEFDVASTHNHRKFGDNGHCATFSHSDLIRVQRSFFLDDDMFEIAREMDQHPMVQYPFEAFTPKRPDIESDTRNQQLVESVGSLVCVLDLTKSVSLCIENHLQTCKGQR